MERLDLLAVEEFGGAVAQPGLRKGTLFGER